MDFDDFWCKMKLRVCLFCFCCFQHTFAESKTTKSFSEVKSVVFSLPSFQRCRQTSMCVCGTFLHELYEKSSQYRNVIKEIWNTSVDVYTHQISSPSEHYKHIQAEKNKKPRNQITYDGALRQASRSATDWVLPGAAWWVRETFFSR